MEPVCGLSGKLVVRAQVRDGLPLGQTQPLGDQPADQCLPGSCWQSIVWTQGTRQVAEATYVAGYPYPKQRSIDEILIPLEAGFAAWQMQ